MREGIDVEVREVGLRDGIQGIKTFFPTEAKKAWLAAEAAAGVPEIEACSFVPAKLFPQFIDAEEVVEEALRHEGLTVSALVPNLRGAERGFALGVHKLNFVLSVSESHNRANVNRAPLESVEQFRLVARARDEAARSGPRVLLTGGLATSLGCSIEGPVSERAVLELVEAYVEAGADEVMLADTIGAGVPAQIRRLVPACRDATGGVPVGLHLHNTRNTGYANAAAGLQHGVTLFDASVGGLGGCPFAPRATGNVATEDLVFLLEGEGARTGIDLEALIGVAEWLSGVLGRPLPGLLHRAGPFPQADEHG